MNFNFLNLRQKCWSDVNSKEETTHRDTYSNRHGHVSAQDNGVDFFYLALIDPLVYSIIDIKSKELTCDEPQIRNLILIFH